jgi:hypothetical protein
MREGGRALLKQVHRMCQAAASACDQVAIKRPNPPQLPQMRALIGPNAIKQWHWQAPPAALRHPIGVCDRTKDDRLVVQTTFRRTISGCLALLECTI